MRLAVYGDSFAFPDSEISWSRVLQKKLNALVYSNYSYPCTSVYYSYKNFKKNYNDYDLNIFLVTDYTRYTKPIDLPSIGQKNISIGNLNQLDYFEKKHASDLSSIELKILSDLRGWWSMHDLEFAEVTHEFLLQDIEKTCENVILIPCYDSSFNESRKQKYNLKFNNSLFNLVGIEKKLLGLENRSVEENKDNLACHMSAELNQLVSEMIINYINSGRNKWIYPENIVHKNNAEYYYKIKE